MFILMCGLPSCGKSVTIDIIIQKTMGPPVRVIRPEDWLPDNINSLGAEAEKNYRIESWKFAISMAEKAVEECNSSELIVLDCANSKFRPLESLLRRAKRNGHKLAVLYVNSRPAQCEARAGDKWVGAQVVQTYVESIRNSLPKFKSKCDRIIIVENTDTLAALEQNALVAWSKLCPTM